MDLEGVDEFGNDVATVCATYLLCEWCRIGWCEAEGGAEGGFEGAVSRRDSLLKEV